MSFIENLLEKASDEEKEKLRHAMFRAVDFIELFFPSPEYFPRAPNNPKKVKLGPYQKKFIDTIQFGFPLDEFKFTDIDMPPEGVIAIWRRQVGKCTLPDTLVQMSDGSLKQMKDLRQGDSVLTYTGDTFTISDPITALPHTKRECVKITTRSGRTIKCGKEHPFLTEVNKDHTEYINAENLTQNSRIAMARSLPDIGKEILTDKEIIFLAYMIAEGCLKHYEYESGKVRKYSFTNKDEEIVKDWIESVDHKYHRTKNSDEYNCKNKKLRTLLDTHNLSGCGSGEKFVPKVVFKSTTGQIALFLSKLINGDGYVQRKKNGTVQIEYCTKSKQLQEDLSHLFLRIGMFAHLFTRHNTKYDEDYYYLRFGSSIDITNAQKHLRLCSRKQKVLDSANPIGNDHIDTFPFPKKIRECRSTHDLTRRECDELLGFEIKYKYSLSPRKANVIKDHFPECEIDTEYLFWDKIESIEEIGERETIDITVPEFHNHITNGFVTHNSFCVAYACAALMILGPESRGAPPTRCGIVAASEPESKRLIDKVKFAIQNSPLKDYLKGKPKVNEVHLKNGSFCIAHTHSSKDVRGPSYDFMFIDEAREMDEEVLFASAIPTVEHGERWTVITTPKGDQGKLIEYYDEALASRPIICTECGREYLQTDFVADFPIRGDITEMPDLRPCRSCDSTSYKYGIGKFATPHLDPWKCPIIDQRKLKRKLDNHGWSPWARQEWLGEIINEASMVILDEWIKKCTHNNERNTMVKEKGTAYVMGIDYGRQHDASSFCITHYDKKRKKVVVDYMRTVSGEYDHDTDYDGIHNHIKEIVSFYNPVLIVPDATGLGAPQVERLQKDVSRWSRSTRIYQQKKDKLGFYIKASNKPDLIGEMITKLSKGEIIMPPKTEPEINELRTELLRFECEVLDRGYIKYGTQNYHDDRVIAFALSLWGHKRERRPTAKIRTFSYGEVEPRKRNNKSSYKMVEYGY